MPIVSNFFARIIARELQLSDEQWLEFLDGSSQSRDSVLWDNQMPLEEFNQLLTNALRISGDPGLGLRFARHSNLLAMGESGLAAITAPTILEAIRSMGDYSRLQSDDFNIDIQVGQQQFELRGQEHLAMGVTRRTQHEALVLTIQNMLEMVLGRDLTEGRYYFAYPAPEYVERYSEVFHCPCEFDAKATGVDVPRSLCEFPSPYFDAVLWEQGRTRSVALMQELNSLDNQLHSRHILSVLRSQTPPLPSAADMARAMNLSERTLMRRLGDEQNTYRQLQNCVLEEWA
ncbi:MAG: AraC family transcriptional regulator ligand-binding domain-containing protein, partial [Pseudomonadota bacterium]|nr:AraC family transcriptional regulator ligand-binding domain-containing protein [Pseudomonadota bacterium]